MDCGVLWDEVRDLNINVRRNEDGSCVVKRARGSETIDGKELPPHSSERTRRTQNRPSTPLAVSSPTTQDPTTGILGNLPLAHFPQHHPTLTLSQRNNHTPPQKPLLPLTKIQAHFRRFYADAHVAEYLNLETAEDRDSALAILLSNQIADFQCYSSAASTFSVTKYWLQGIKCTVKCT